MLVVITFYNVAMLTLIRQWTWQTLFSVTHQNAKIRKKKLLCHNLYCQTTICEKQQAPMLTTNSRPSDCQKSRQFWLYSNEKMPVRVSNV